MQDRFFISSSGTKTSSIRSVSILAQYQFQQHQSSALLIFWKPLWGRLSETPESGKVITEDELNRLMKDYYRLRGWE
jgi:hypothetical protein